ncbi:cell division protein FtsX [Candidatus Symbiothrix dinenymphae]|nr:cell division protein FtsX [Candidatus Symbiothrix dinenymphae]
MKLINSKITTTVSMALVLFVLGLVLLIYFFANNFSNHIKETLAIDIVMQDGTTSDQIKQLQARLESQPFAKSTTFHSKEEALQELERELGESPKEFLGFNPLPDVIVLHLNAEFATPENLNIVKDELKNHSSDIQNTEYREGLLNAVNNNLEDFCMALLVLAALLMFISYVLINNTIRLAVYSKRFLIHTMQLVGAKKSFIRQPFITSNIWSGIAASVVACGMLYGVVSYTTAQLPDMEKLLNRDFLGILFICVLLLGVLISILSTVFAVNKYLDSNVDELYSM